MLWWSGGTLLSCENMLMSEFLRFKSITINTFSYEVSLNVVKIDSELCIDLNNVHFLS